MTSDPAFDALRRAHPGLALRSGRVRVAGLELHVVEAGPAEAAPVLLLHGFPEFWWSWRRQLPALAAAGWRAVAPDLPGYNLSERPRGLAAYRLDRLSGVVEALIDHLSPAPVPLIAHDWGGALAWWAALRRPERIARLAILNMPHPAVLRRALLRDPDQRRRSRYMLTFQLPWLPERRLLADDGRALRSMLRRTSRPGTFSDDELATYAAAAARPGAMTAMLAWYRAALRRPPRRPAHRRVEPETLILWGLADVALGPALVAPSAARCRSARVVEFPGAGHWLQHEEPQAINRELLAFLAASG